VTATASNIGFSRLAGTVVAKNNIAYNCYFAGFSGTFDGTSEYNGSDDSTEPGSNGIDITGIVFVDDTGDVDGDYHIDPTNPVGIVGADLSGTFTVDIDNDTRVNWSIGADDGPSGITEVTLDTASIVLAGQSVTITPGAVTVPLDTAQIAINGQAVIVSPGSRLIELETAQIVLNGQAVTVQGAGASVVLETAGVTLSGGQVAVSPAAVTIPLATGTITINGQSIVVAAGTLVDLETAAINLTGQAVQVTPGPVTVVLATGSLTISGIAVGVENVVPTAPIVLDPDRRVVVDRENRLLVVDAQHRILVVQTEIRLLVVD
jgi:hypothetical protein